MTCLHHAGSTAAVRKCTHSIMTTAADSLLGAHVVCFTASVLPILCALPHVYLCKFLNAFYYFSFLWDLDHKQLIKNPAHQSRAFWLRMVPT